MAKVQCIKIFDGSKFSLFAISSVDWQTEGIIGLVSTGCVYLTND